MSLEINETTPSYSDSPEDIDLTPEEWEDFRTSHMEECEEKIRDAVNYAKELRLPFIAARLEEYLTCADWRIAQAFADVLGNEADRRRADRLNRSLAAAKLRYPAAALDDRLNEPERELDVEQIRQLNSCRWIDNRQNLLITGMTGAGKTYLACALAARAITEGRTARYARTSALLCELDRANVRDELEKAVSRLKKLDVLILDDFGLMRLDLDKCRSLFEVIDGRDGVASTVIVSQYPVSAWYELFENATYAEAILDRLIKGAHRVEMNGPSLRRVEPTHEPVQTPEIPF